MTKHLWRRICLDGIKPESGFAFQVDYDRGSLLGSHRHPSPAWILENGLPLPGPADVQHETIRSVGNGSFSFWHNKIYLSSSDNSDPRTNGRLYELVYPVRVPRPIQRFGRVLPILGVQEFPDLDVRFDQTLWRDVEYAAKIAHDYVSSLSKGWASLPGKTVLELGPGSNHGTALLMACFDARVHVADPYLTPWNNLYHPAFYTTLRDWVKAHLPKANLTPLDRIIKANAYDSAVSHCHPCSAERLDGIPNASIDLMFSNAVLEHIDDLPLAIANLARVSRAGSLGFHQVDFRCHETLDQPLEFLLTGETEFAAEFSHCQGRCGNRWRPMELKRLFTGAGFEVEFTPTMFVDDGYLTQFLPRLRAAGSRFRNLDIGELQVLGGSFRTRKR